MKKTTIILVTAVLVTATSAFAAEKSKILVQLDASRAAVDALALKVGENREAAAALEQARTSLQKATDVYGKGRQMFGLGDLKPEAEAEVKGYLEISDIAVTTAASRLEKAQAVADLEVIDKQLESVKAKVKIFDDRKAELEKLKADVAKCQSTARELETMKAENFRLSVQIEKQLAEIKALTVQLDEAKKNAVKAAVPEVKPVSVPEVKPVTVPEVKPVTVPEVKPVALPEVKPVTLPAPPVAEIPAAAKGQPAPAKETPGAK